MAQSVRVRTDNVQLAMDAHGEVYLLELADLVEFHSIDVGKLMIGLRRERLLPGDRPIYFLRIIAYLHTKLRFTNFDFFLRTYSL